MKRSGFSKNFSNANQSRGIRRRNRGGPIAALIGAGALLGSPTFAAADQEKGASYSAFERFFHSYADEWGRPPADDPAAPPSRRPEPFPPQPVTTPPYPFTDWPYGGSSTIGATLPNSQGGALMKALSASDSGAWLKDNHIEIYGWLNAGGNLSNATRGSLNGNAPAAYMYRPDVFQLDQAVLYVERLPDTVQKDHIDWGFRLSGLYGENYRYTTSYGLASYQLLKQNAFNGYDVPMVYGELYVPWIAQGLVLRVGRFISLPDIEAQLAPNNYMYSHSFAYAYDNYTNTGINATLQLNKNWMVQAGLTNGTDTAIWNSHKTDPGAQPTGSACVRWTSDSSNDNIYACANGINDGAWGYNNLQWYGATYYHKFDELWHFAFEAYHLHQRKVPNVNNVNPTPFDTIRSNVPNKAVCKASETECTAGAFAALAYLNYKFSPLDNISLRGEFYDDENGQRTGTKTRYFNYAVGWQHWLSPSVIFRPEIAWYNALDKAAFDNGTLNTLAVVSADVIVKF